MSDIISRLVGSAGTALALGAKTRAALLDEAAEALATVTRERDEARAELAEARTQALEEAAEACDHCAEDADAAGDPEGAAMAQQLYDKITAMAKSARNSA